MSEKSEIETFWKKLFGTMTAIRLRHERVHGLPPPSAGMFRILMPLMLHAEGRLRVKDLAGNLNVTPGAVSQLMDKLERDGLIVRCRDTADRRVVNIELAEKGRRMRSRMHREITSDFTWLLAGVSDEKRRIFAEVLDAMRDNLERKTTESKSLHETPTKEALQ